MVGSRETRHLPPIPRQWFARSVGKQHRETEEGPNTRFVLTTPAPGGTAAAQTPHVGSRASSSRELLLKPFESSPRVQIGTCPSAGGEVTS